MAKVNFSYKTLDDVMHETIKEIFKNGTEIQPEKGKCKELIGVAIEIHNPRARLSSTEKKGKLFSAIGELSWYLSKSNNVDFISYYIPKYLEFAERNKIFGGYGPRLFRWRNINQINNVVNILKKQDSRKAVIQLFDAKDLIKPHKDTPCTCLLQFFNRQNQLHMVSYMRSNDAFIGLPHDIFCFTMIQEIIARTLNIEMGFYKHFVGSLHLYEENYEDAKKFIDEGYQSTYNEMPAMPLGDPWKSIQILLKSEACLRKKGIYPKNMQEIDPYWKDIISLYEIFYYVKRNNQIKILEAKSRLTSTYFNQFIDGKIKNN